MDDCRFHQPESRCVIAALAEIGILIYRARDETGDLGDAFGVGAEDEGEGCGECGG